MKYKYYGCTGLKSINLPSSLTVIDEKLFSGCKSLSSINIPNSVTTIKREAFYNCTGLTSIIFGNNVSEIKDWAFMWCSGLTSITLTNSLSCIRVAAFKGCSRLKSIILGNNISKIEHGAFAQCDELTDVYCLSKKVPSTSNGVFVDSYPQAITLHVPTNSIDAYQASDPWNKFKAIVPLEDSDPSETRKCNVPIITYNNGMINFSCETEGVVFVSNVTTEDVNTYYTSSVTLSQKYKVSVYATKDGYENSDTVTMEIVDSGGIKGDLNGDGVVNVTDHVKLSEIIMKQK